VRKCKKEEKNKHARAPAYAHAGRKRVVGSDGARHKKKEHKVMFLLNVKGCCSCQLFIGLFTFSSVFFLCISQSVYLFLCREKKEK
jgi:hypothetical protein